MIDQTVPVDKRRALLDGEGSAEDKIQEIYVTHEVTYVSNTFKTEAICTCGWTSGTWPADGSAQYAGSMHLAEWREEA